MIKNFETYINEDYFSKLANRKDIGDVRKENKFDIDEWFKNKVVNDKYHIGTLIDSYTINKDGSVDVIGNISIDEDDLVNGELPFKFGKILKIDANNLHNQFYELTSNDVINCYGNFEIRNNSMKTLKNCPDYVDGDFNCGWNDIEDLEGCPKYVGGSFHVDHCEKLKSFKGGPERIHGHLFMGNAISLNSLEGFPKLVKLDIHARIEKRGIPSSIKITKPFLTDEKLEGICVYRSLRNDLIW